MFVFVPVNPAPPSPEAEDLGLQIAALVRDYRAINPEVSGHEVTQALTIARTALRSDVGGLAANPAAVMGVFLGLVALVGLAVFYFVQSGQTPAPVVFPVIIGIMIAAFGLLLVVRGR